MKKNVLKSVLVLAVLFSFYTLNAQHLTISTSGEASPGTNWSITGNTLNVAASGSANIHPSVIINHLTNTGDLTIVLPHNAINSRDLYLNNTIAYTGSIARTLTFNITNDIIFASNVGITSSNASLNLVFRTALSTSNIDHGRIALNQSTIQTNGGNLWMGGGSGTTTWNGLTVGNSMARVWADDLSGVSIVNSSINSNGGNIYMYGRSFNTSDDIGTNNFGTNIENSSVSSLTGSITVIGDVLGRYTNCSGTRIIATTSHTSLLTTSGAISISGIGSDSPTNGNGWRIATNISGSNSNAKTQISSISGNIQIEGNANFAATVNDKEGIVIAGFSEITSRTGNISIKGTNTLESSGQYSNSIRFATSNVTNSIRIGFDGTNSYAGNILIEGNSIYQRLNNAGAGSISIQTAGNLTIQPTGTAFTYMRAGDAATLTFDDDWNFGTNLGSFTYGKVTNNANISFSNNLTVAGPINILGGIVTIDANLTSSANGDVFIKGITTNNPSIIVNSGRTINKSAGSGTLTLQGHSRIINNGTISASGTGVLNVVMWSDFDNSNNDGGVSHIGTISTNGGHVWMGGSNSNGGSYTWNGLTVGDGPSIGNTNYNNNPFDLFGSITTSNGHVFAWAGNGIGSNAIVANANAFINAGSGNITLMADQVYTTSTFPLTTTGTISLVPNEGSYASDLTLGGTLSSGNFSFNTGHYSGLRINNLSTVGGLTIGRTEELLSNGSPIVFSNSSIVTISSALSIAGPIHVYGGTITANANLTSTASTGTGISLNGQKIIQNSGVAVTTSGANINYLASGFSTTSGVDESIKIGGVSGARASINAAGGTISLTGSFGTTSTAGLTDYGIWLFSTDVITSGTGQITLTGDATNTLSTGSAYGISMGNATVKTASGAITLNGTGGKASTNSRGIVADQYSNKILSVSGAITFNEIKPTGLTGTFNGFYMRPSSTLNTFIGADGIEVSSSSSSVSIKGNRAQFELNGTFRNNINTSGAIVIESVANTFEIAPTLTALTISGNPASVRIGKSTNTANITLASAVTAAGPITIYGGILTINENLNTSAGASLGNVLLKGSGDVILAASKSINTNGAPVVLWANSDNQTSNGSVALQNGSSIVTGSGSVAGGHIWIGGGSDGTTWNGLAVGNGYAVPATLDHAVYIDRSSLSSFGGHIKIAGDGSSDGWIAITTLGEVNVNAGAGTIEFDGQMSSSAAGNRIGLLFGYHDNTYQSTVNISSSAAGNAITLSGIGRGSEDAIHVSGALNVTSSGGGHVDIKGNALGTGRGIIAGGYYDGIINVFANSGDIRLNGYTKAVQVADGINASGLTPGQSKLNIGQGGSISSSSSDVFITGDNIALAAGGIDINTSGKVTVEPSSASFASAVSFPIANLNIVNTITGLTIGKPSNAANVTIASATTIAGPISIYGGTVALNQNIESSNGSTITLLANTLTIPTGKTVKSLNGQLIVAPQNIASTVGLAGATGTLQLPASYFSTNFVDGFSNIQIGTSNHTGAIAVNTFTLKDPMTLLTTGALTLGGKPLLGENNLTLGSGITNITSNSSNYIKTNGGGKVIRTIPTGSNLLFPVGKALYNPVSIKNNTGSQDVFSVRVLDSVFLTGTSGTLITTPHVKATWDIFKTNTNAGSGVDFEFGWNASQEVGTISSYKLNHYATTWSFAAGTSGIPSGTTTKTMSHTDYTGTFSPFAISEGSSALPVELISFNANCTDNATRINWQTASEHQSASFELEKSRDGANWSVVETIAAAGHSSSILDYSLIDTEQSADIVYYRLNQVDQDGASKIYGPISAHCGEAIDFSAGVFPNPTSGELSIQINNVLAQNVHIQICGADGKVLVEGIYTLEAGTTQLPFNLEIVNAGMYTVKVQGESATETIKLIVK